MLNWLRMRIWIFPVWLWIVLATGGFALFFWMRKKKGGGGDGSSVIGSPQAPQLGDPPFLTDPQYSGGRQEPGYNGPNTDVPGWMNIPPVGSPGASNNPPLSDTWTPFPTVTVPQLPSFDPIPPLTPTGSSVMVGPDGRLTTAGAAIAKSRVAEKLFPGDSTANVLVTAKEAIKQKTAAVAANSVIKVLTPKPAAKTAPVSKVSTPKPASSKPKVAKRVTNPTPAPKPTPAPTTVLPHGSAAAKFRANRRNFVK